MKNLNSFAIHGHKIVQTWLIWNCPHLVNPFAQSPGLNVIENFWALIDQNVWKHKISNKETRKNALKEEWNKIDPETTQKLVTSMINRLKDVVKQQGGHTKY